MPISHEALGMAVGDPMRTVYAHPEVTDFRNGIAKAHQDEYGA